MPYVLEYTGRHYQKRRAVRRAALAAVAATLAVAAFVAAWAVVDSRRPTFHDVVAMGYEDPKTHARIPSYQSLADRAFSLQSEWSATVERQKELMPYLRLSWSAVPATNVVAAFAEAVASFPKSYRDRPVARLSPQGFSLRMADKPEDWTGPDSSYVPGLVLSVRWRTAESHDEDAASAARAALSNLFAFASSPLVATNARVCKVDFPAGNRAGLEVFAEYAFPTIRRLPVSKNLGKIETALLAFHEEAASAAVLDAKKSGGEKISVADVYRDIDKGKRFADEFARSMDPGAWLGRHPLFNASGKSAVIAWNAATTGRYPWRRSLQRKLMSSKNWYDPVKFGEFVKSLPTPPDIAGVRATYDEKCQGFTNAVDNAAFVAYDVEDVNDPKRIHETRNLLDEAYGSAFVPTNRFFGMSLDGESLVLRHPRRKNSGGIRLGDSFGRTNRYAFAEWTYSFASTNAPSAFSALPAGLAGFTGEGQGWAPVSLDVSFDDGASPPRVSRVEIRGLLPVRLPAEEN